MIALLALWNCREVPGFDFVAMDDDINIYFNPHLGPPAPALLKWVFTDVDYMRRYVPLGWLGFSSVYAFSGLSPVGYHLANIALHAANGLLLYLLLLQLLRWWRGSSVPCLSLIHSAGIGAAIWALHPLRAETVGWASGLLYSLSTFFALLSLLAYVAMYRATVQRRQRVLLLLMAAGCYACALLTYPVALGLVVVFVMIDWVEWQRRGAQPANGESPCIDFRRLAAEKLAFLIPAVVVLGCTIVARYEVNSFWPKPPSLHELGPWHRVMQAFYVWAVYIWKSIWPAHLTPMPTDLVDFHPGELRFVMSAVVVTGITLFCLRSAWRRGALPLWICYLALLLPVGGWTERPHFASDRYAYLAGTIFSVAIAVSVASLKGRWRVPLMGATIGIVILLASLQQAQLEIWKNTDALMARIAAASNNEAVDAMNYRRWALFHAQRHRPEVAQRVLAEASRTHGAATWFAELKTEIARYDHVGDISAGTPPAGVTMASWLHAKLAQQFSQTLQYREAHEHFEAALRLDPELDATVFNFAVMCTLEGNTARALHLYFRLALDRSKHVPPVAERRLLALIADAFFRQEKIKLACQALERALREAESPAESNALQIQLEGYRRVARG